MLHISFLFKYVFWDWFIVDWEVELFLMHS